MHSHLREAYTCHPCIEIVCIHVCIDLCVYVCTYVFSPPRGIYMPPMYRNSVYTCMYRSMCVCMYVCILTSERHIHATMYVSAYTCVHSHLLEGIYMPSRYQNNPNTCMHRSMCVCMYVRILTSERACTCHPGIEIMCVHDAQIVAGA